MAALVVLTPALALVAWGAVRQRTGDVEERLVREANATFTAAVVRPVHVAEASAGRFGDALAAHLPSLAARLARAHGVTRAVLQPFADGERPVEELPRETVLLLQAGRGDLDALLAGTHAASAAPPPDREGIHQPARGVEWRSLGDATLMVAVRARQRLAAGDLTGAAADCVDGLAVARDVAQASGIVGSEEANAEVAALTPACASVIATISPAGRATLAAQLVAIADAFPPIARTLTANLLAFDLEIFGLLLHPARRARLAPAAARLVGGGAAATTWWQSLALRDAWRAVRADEDRFVAAVGLPDAAARDAACDAADARAQRRLNPAAAIMAVNWCRYARRADARRVRLAGLIALAAAIDHRDAEGRWPGDIASLAGRGALREEDLAHLAGAELRATDAGLELWTPLPQGSDRDPVELLLRIRASP
jgi:hypothetical protein